MKSRLRPETTDADSGTFCPRGLDAYYRIRDAVRRREKLIYGALRGHGGVCAIGAYFNDNRGTALPYDLIDEVASYNDSIPRFASEKQRRRKVLAWLNFRIRALSGWVGSGRVPKEQRSKEIT